MSAEARLQGRPLQSDWIGLARSQDAPHAAFGSRARLPARRLFGRSETVPGCLSGPGCGRDIQGARPGSEPVPLLPAAPEPGGIRRTFPEAALCVLRRCGYPGSAWDSSARAVHVGFVQGHGLSRCRGRDRPSQGKVTCRSGGHLMQALANHEAAFLGVVSESVDRGQMMSCYGRERRPARRHLAPTLPCRDRGSHKHTSRGGRARAEGAGASRSASAPPWRFGSGRCPPARSNDR